MWNQHLKDSNNSNKMQIKSIKGFWRITPQQNCNLEFSEAHSNSRENWSTLENDRTNNF